MTRYAFSRVPDSDDQALCIVLNHPAASRVAMRDVERLHRQNISEDVPACVFGYSRATHQLTDKSGNLLYMATTNPYRLRPIVPATFGLTRYNASGTAALSWVPANPAEFRFYTHRPVDLDDLLDHTECVADVPCPLGSLVLPGGSDSPLHMIRCFGLDRFGNQLCLDVSYVHRKTGQLFNHSYRGLYLALDGKLSDVPLTIMTLDLPLSEDDRDCPNVDKELRFRPAAESLDRAAIALGFPALYDKNSALKLDLRPFLSQVLDLTAGGSRSASSVESESPPESPPRGLAVTSFPPAMHARLKALRKALKTQVRPPIVEAYLGQVLGYGDDILDELSIDKRLKYGPNFVVAEETERPTTRPALRYKPGAVNSCEHFVPHNGCRGGHVFVRNVAGYCRMAKILLDTHGRELVDSAQQPVILHDCGLARSILDPDYNVEYDFDLVHHLEMLGTYYGIYECEDPIFRRWDMAQTEPYESLGIEGYVPFGRDFSLPVPVGDALVRLGSLLDDATKRYLDSSAARQRDPPVPPADPVAAANEDASAPSGVSVPSSSKNGVTGTAPDVPADLTQPRQGTMMEGRHPIVSRKSTQSGSLRPPVPSQAVASASFATSKTARATGSSAKPVPGSRAATTSKFDADQDAPGLTSSSGSGDSHSSLIHVLDLVAKRTSKDDNALPPGADASQGDDPPVAGVTPSGVRRSSRTGRSSTGSTGKGGTTRRVDFTGTKREEAKRPGGPQPRGLFQNQDGSIDLTATNVITGPGASRFGAIAMLQCLAGDTPDPPTVLNRSSAQAYIAALDPPLHELTGPQLRLVFAAEPMLLRWIEPEDTPHDWWYRPYLFPPSPGAKVPPLRMLRASGGDDGEEEFVSLDTQAQLTERFMIQDLVVAGICEDARQKAISQHGDDLHFEHKDNFKGIMPGGGSVRPYVPRCKAKTTSSATQFVLPGNALKSSAELLIETLQHAQHMYGPNNPHTDVIQGIVESNLSMASLIGRIIEDMARSNVPAAANAAPISAMMRMLPYGSSYKHLQPSHTHHFGKKPWTDTVDTARTHGESGLLLNLNAKRILEESAQAASARKAKSRKAATKKRKTAGGSVASDTKRRRSPR